MKQRIPAGTDPSRLQSDLLPQILDLLRADALPPGARLSDLRVAERLQVSRTPVRSAFSHLAQHGVLYKAERGFMVGTAEAADRLRLALAIAVPDEAAHLTQRLATDREKGLLPAEVSEADLMRRYGAGRRAIQRVLAQLARLGAVERKAGHGWMFPPMLDSPTARRESLRWRMLVEPGGLLEPGYHLDPAWAADIQDRHEQMLAAAWSAAASIAFFEMNAAFHEGLAAGSGNRHVVAAVRQQNSLRRLANYRWGFAGDTAAVERRAHESCREHLAILAHLAAGDHEVAAALMRRHIGRVLEAG